MDIYITHGIGQGLSNVSAFDAALIDAGIGNYNLLPLSSVIPPGSSLIRKKLDRNNIEIGFKLFVVISHAEIDVAGESIFVGLGWRYNKRKGGIFAEHSSKTKQQVIECINNSVSSMAEIRSLQGESDYEIVEAKCTDQPISAVVAAVYKSENWGS